MRKAFYSASPSVVIEVLHITYALIFLRSVCGVLISSWLLIV